MFTSSLNASNKNISKEIIGKIYYTEEHEFDLKKDKWQFKNSYNSSDLYIGFVDVHLGQLENVIVINSQNPINISYKELKIITDNKDVITFESDAKFKYLSDDNSSNCRISMSRFKNSGMTVLHVFFIKKKWLSFYYSKESNIDEIMNKDWSLKSLTLPFDDVTIPDVEVDYFYSKANKINYNKILFNNVSPIKRAKVTFSNNGLSTLLYDKSGNVQYGSGHLGLTFSIKERNENSITYNTIKRISDNEYQEFDIIIYNGNPYNDLYNIQFNYKYILNNLVTEGFILKKNNFQRNVNLRIF